MDDISSAQPLFNYVLIKPLQGEEVTKSGIVLPDTAQEKPQMGEVMAVGAGYSTPDGNIIPPPVKVGDRVIYKKWGGSEVKVKNEDYLIIEDQDIMAIV